MPAIPPPDRLVALPDGRRLGVDDRGDPDGFPVLYVHGTPDSRLARHPDDSIAAALGIRLVAVDRPGIGGSDADPGATPESVAEDLAAVLDALGIDRAGVLAWSAGSIFALALCGAHRDRVRRCVLVAPLVPAEAYADPGVLAGADDSRRLFADSLASMTPDEIGTELAMWLVPPEIDTATAEAMLETSLVAVAEIPGAAEQLVTALCASVAGGMGGVERDLVAQAMPLGPLLDRIDVPVEIHVGTADVVTPPAMSTWVASRLGAEVELHEGDGHALAIVAWRAFLERCSVG